MAINLIKMISESITPEMLQGVAGFTGEGDAATQSGLAALLPVILGGMANKVNMSGGPGNLFSMVTAADVDAGLVGRLTAALSGNQSAALLSVGSSLMSGLFGSKAGGIGTALASVTGLRASSASSLIGVAAPLVFGFIKKHVADHRIDAGGLANLLLDQRQHLAGAIDPKFTSA